MMENQDRRIRIIIGEYYAMQREAFVHLLRSVPEFEVVGEAGDGKEILQLLRSQKVDIVLMELTIKPMHGLETLVKIRKRGLEAKVIVFTTHEEPSLVKDCIEAGATVIFKSENVLELKRTILEVNSKGT
jgi:DNA-binding NarL/FixJ family response regulator